MITAATYSFPYEAQIARAKLESENIPAFVADEHTINAQWLYSQAVGGVRLQVPNEHVKKAAEILNCDHSEALQEQQGNDPLLCPSCSSKDVEQFVQGRRLTFITFLFLGFPLWPYKYTILCNQCGSKSRYGR